MFENIKHIFMYDTKMNQVSHFVADADTGTDFCQVYEGIVSGDLVVQWNEATDLEGVVNSLREAAKDDTLPSMIVLDKKGIIIYCPTKQAKKVMCDVFDGYNINYLGNEIDFFKDMYSVDMGLSE
jgi:hypothetical protein